MSCRQFGNVIVCGPGTLTVLQEKPIGERWCFKCRARVDFVDVLLGEVAPSWYAPQWGVKCVNGHEDGDLFPGRYREYREYDG